jgi:hypothetical protein
MNKMKYKVYLTEHQIKLFVENQILTESLFKNINSFGDLLKMVKNLAFKGVLTATMVASICHFYKLNDEQKEQIENIANQGEEATETDKEINPWQLACDTATATVYNAVPDQCNADCGRTASMFRLNLSDVYSHRIIAIERTMMKKYGLQMGDVVYLEGVGKFDGVWQVQDKMNKKFAGQDKIDLLVPDNIKTGKWDNVKIYTLKDKSMTGEFKSELAPQLSKSAFSAQFNKMG